MKAYQSKEELMRNHYIEQLQKYQFEIRELERMSTDELKHKLTIQRALEAEHSKWF